VTAALDPAAVRVLLCDADGNLFPSEEPAFAASTRVTNACLERLGVDRRFDPDELRQAAAGRNFRATITMLAEHAGVSDALTPDRLEAWVAEERRAVTEHLGEMLGPDVAVTAPLARLARRFALAVVSSSALGRLDACFEATGLAELFPAACRYSAEDSLPTPTSKPDPAVYLHAGRQLGVTSAEGLAIEDSVPGAQSAVAAGFATVGNLMFVAPAERVARERDLRAAGVAAVVSSWWELEALVTSGAWTSPGSARAV
jgi:beta-phosphoglucomutase-like phosphatase (HAD superfamily)